MRRRKAEKRQTIPDIRFNDIIIARLINTVMERGKKTVAQGIVYGAMDILKEKKADMEPLEVFRQALENVKPRLEAGLSLVSTTSVGRKRVGHERKVRAAKGTALLKMEAIGDSWSRQKRMTALRFKDIRIQ
jgi:ribosomal protein S7